MDWRAACIASLYEGRGDSWDFGRNRGLGLLSMIGKKYDKALLDRSVKCIEGRIGEE